MSDWHLYLVRTDAGALYTGISTDVDKRFETHQLGLGSKYLRGNQPAKLVYRCQIGDRSLTSKVEYRVKQLDKPAKENIVRSAPSREQLLDIVDLCD
jgi:putative endonuclease